MRVAMNELLKRCSLEASTVLAMESRRAKAMIDLLPHPVTVDEPTGTAKIVERR